MLVLPPICLSHGKMLETNWNLNIVIAFSYNVHPEERETEYYISKDLQFFS